MAGIRKITYKNKHGVEKTKYYIIYKDINGKQCTSGIGYNTRSEARKHLGEYDNEKTPEKDITLEYIFNLYWKKTIKYADGTQYNYKKYYDRYLKCIENIKYRKLTVIFLQEFFDKIEAISPHSAQYALKMCKAAVNNAIKKQKIRENIFNFIDTIELPKTKKNHINIKSIKQFLDLARRLLSKRDYVIVYLFIGSGLREGELFAINKSDINLQELSIEVNKQFTRNKLKFKPKTDSSYRTVYIFQDLGEVLYDYMQDLDGDILFPNSIGGYINATNFRERVWKPFLEKIGITKRIRIHDLRGSYVDMALSNGLSPKFAQNQLGHAKNATTMDWYAKNSEDMIEIAQETFNQIFNSGEKMVKINEVEPENKIISMAEYRNNKGI